MITTKKIEHDEDVTKYVVIIDGNISPDIEIEKWVEHSYYTMWYKGYCQGGFKTLKKCCEFIETKLL